MTTPYDTDEARWAAVQARDGGAAGHFVYAVATTGIFCRPGCASRAPLRRNVAYFATPQDAAAAGYRACLRCRPLDPTPGADPRVVRVCRLLEEALEPLSLDHLAGEVGLSKEQLHRLCKAELGLTPREYAQALREKRLRRALDQGQNVTEALYEAGYGSSSRLYETAMRDLGMTPGQVKKGGAGLELAYALAQSFLGLVLVAASARGICAIQMGDDAEALVAELGRRFPRARIQPGGSAFAAWVAEVVDHLSRTGSGRGLPLDIQGTAFQRKVWRALQEIPPGRVETYGHLAQRLGLPRAARAVGTACGANPVAWAIPCHRALRGDGTLGGYAWGPARKVALLAHEDPGDEQQ